MDKAENKQSSFTNISFDHIILDRYKNHPLISIVKQTLIGYKKIFNLVFETYNQRFKMLYDEELFHLRYIDQFFEYFYNENDEIERDILDSIKKLKLNDQVKVLENSNVYFVESESEFNQLVKKQKSIKGKSKGTLNIGYNKMDIFDELDSLLFNETNYFLDVAEEHKIIGTRKKHKTTAKKSFYEYEKKDRIITKHKAYQLATGETGKSDPDNPEYATFLIYIRLKDKLKHKGKEISESIREELKKFH